MSRNHMDSKIDYRRLAELSEEFTSLWMGLHAFYLDAVAGFSFVRAHVEAEQKRARSYVRGSDLDSEEFQDTRMFTYSDIFSDNFVASAIHTATQGEVKFRNKPDGRNFITLGQLCLVSFYDFWNEYLRKEYVIAKGFIDRREKNNSILEKCMRDHASHDLWGDIYYLRTSIVHKLGIANSDVEKCKLIKWFKPGDKILLTPNRMHAIFSGLYIYRNELFSEQFPEHLIRIPKNYGSNTIK